MRRLFVALLASATFGGVIGALVTAAVQSRASPGAIAAAVQKVQDQNAERSLTAINDQLRSLLAAVNRTTVAVDRTTSAVDKTSRFQGQDATSLYNRLSAICRNAASTSSETINCTLGTPPPTR